MKYLILLLLLSSCSASNLMHRALKKDPNIVKSDTVIVERIVEGTIGTASGIDSVIIDNERVFIKAIATGEIDLKYHVKDYKFHDTTEVTNVVVPPSSSQVRQQEKTKRTIAKEEGKTNRVGMRTSGRNHKNDLKHEEKIAKIENNHWRWFGFGFVSCLVFIVLCRYLSRKIRSYIGQKADQDIKQIF